MLVITPWERNALQMLADGCRGHDIADRLQVTALELDRCLSMLFVRMGVASRAEAIAASVRRGLVSAERQTAVDDLFHADAASIEKFM